ncbi:MAG: D-glycero-beta-D-manno-heptose-7-phosphate kinase [Candidatus Omnitrophica bacterium CG11_big_fil_rev_8_21_14_0_20_45_26]|uniref:D-glycero-beta-D-manno-heptose-7-phosphate kinase n=1 Tax=Candidatus Abzuiibacterium crystallinum TaxID=1974748 RepID=A0A2H0LMX3_9BACT|nr:MAG: D-glycero-beta-D-manno-heptose-7-phosphate kinase [Candidatus Omnitrophica bacterium CG11_big_fil_rev_8_21_14_0_20_45_26]PIW65202.1 MAG: D-glycero-beta-D-manno-heptose-7-phosphate kinase [Candidatus Omnitrophica bacterium CG12_big_fil_rev_8_21_14_0_65_45_16]
MGSSRKRPQLSSQAHQKARLLDIIRRFDSAHILVLGDFILDEFVWGQVERISPEAPVPVVNVQRQSFMPGGALNVAHNIRTLKGIVYPCGVVGRDLHGRMLVREIRKQKIETGGVIYDRDRPTTLKTRVIAHSQQVVRFDREKGSDLKPVDAGAILKFVRQSIEKAKVVIIEDYGKGVVTPALIQKVLTLCRKKRIPVVVDPKEKHFLYYRGVTAITPNKKEAFSAYASLFNKEGSSIESVGKGLLQKLNCQAVVMTLGEDGMAVFEKGGRMTKVPTAAREVYDVSGAGDTVIAVLGLALAAGATMKDAAWLANVAAGVVVGKLGTASLVQKELTGALKEHVR